jgi:hypothetical protein
MGRVEGEAAVTFSSSSLRLVKPKPFAWQIKGNAGITWPHLRWCRLQTRLDCDQFASLGSMGNVARHVVESM